MSDVLDLHLLDSEIESNSGDDPEVIAMTSDGVPEAAVAASDDSVTPYVPPGIDTIDTEVQYIPVGTEAEDAEVQYIPDPEVQYLQSGPSTSGPTRGDERSGASGTKGDAGTEESNGFEDRRPALQAAGSTGKTVQPQLESSILGLDLLCR